MTEPGHTSQKSMQLRTYRHELKYYISQKEYKICSGLFREILSMDSHCSEHCQYWIRSLYFDTMDNNDFYEKVIGENRRKKIRLRLYDIQQGQVKVEIKNRDNQYMMKETAFLNRHEAGQLIKGNKEILLKKNNPTLNRVYYFFSRDYYRPTVLIDYDREAYLCQYQNIRITFDKYIRASTVDFDLFGREVNMVPVFEKDVVVLEVKYQQFLPHSIREIISNCSGMRDAISKYCMSRVIY